MQTQCTCRFCIFVLWAHQTSWIFAKFTEHETASINKGLWGGSFCRILKQFILYLCMFWIDFRLLSKVWACWQWDVHVCGDCQWYWWFHLSSSHRPGQRSTRRYYWCGKIFRSTNNSKSEISNFFVYNMGGLIKLRIKKSFFRLLWGD